MVKKDCNFLINGKRCSALKQLYCEKEEHCSFYKVKVEEKKKGAKKKK